MRDVDGQAKRGRREGEEGEEDEEKEEKTKREEDCIEYSVVFVDKGKADKRKLKRKLKRNQMNQTEPKRAKRSGAE